MPIELKPRKRPAQLRSSLTVDAILTAAIRILLKDGYQRLTTTEVARVAGVSVGSLYQYFPNKQAIIAAVIARHMDEVRAAITAAPSESAADLADAVDIIMVSFLAEKRRKISLSRALHDAFADVAGRDIVIAASRALVADLAEKLSPALGRPLTEEDMIRLRIAVSAVEGTVSELIMSQPEDIKDPTLAYRLRSVFISASGWS